MPIRLTKFKDTDISSPFFDSLKADYREFVNWFKKKSEHEAYVFTNDEGAIDGFLYLKREDDAVTDITPALPALPRIKIGTFKINPHGTRLGEMFIKKALDHAIREGVTELYVTAFEKHAYLVELFKRYGFEDAAKKTTDNGTELVMLRRLFSETGDVLKDYPIIRATTGNKYLLSIYPEWHTRLFPESKLLTESPDIILDVSHTNSIHKVYLSRMSGMGSLRRGDVLVIYRTSDNKGPALYRSVATSICVTEEARNINTFQTKEEFIKYCKPYSVFTEEELNDFYRSKKYPHLIRFTYNAALGKRIIRKELLERAGLDASQYWGIMRITDEQFTQIAKLGGVGKCLIVHQA